MSKTLQKFKHIPVKEETYKRVQSYGKYGDSMDSIVSRIFDFFEDTLN